MATKVELIARLEELIAQEDVEQASDAVDGVKEAYEALISAAQQDDPSDGHEEDDGESDPAEAPTPNELTKQDGETGSDAPVHIESAQPQDEEDKRFKQLLDAFNQKVNEIRRQKAREENENMAAKKAIMDELKTLIAGEENIGTAFQRFGELQEQWKGIGNVPQQHYRELQTDFSHLRDEFFYHIRIYKELRDHDLRKNTALKQALVSDMTALAENDNVRELEGLVKEYQEKWQHVGPVVREEWEAIRDAFSNATRTVYDKIHEHYKARRAEYEANLQAKQALVDKAKVLVDELGTEVQKDWKALTEHVLELQNAWKQVGFATKKENERIWKEFRNACNAFFDAKKVHFDALREQYREARDKKTALVQQAVALKESTEWRKTAELLKDLQKQWKEAGSAGPRDENKLWNRFRAACDEFFKARKASYAKLDAEQAVHVKEKEDILKELSEFALSGDRNKDIEQLKAFSARWVNSGRVSPKMYDTLNERYRSALDMHYGKLKMEGEERRKAQFQDRVESLKNAPDGRDRIERENRFLKRKIEEVQTEIRQMEGNMGMFNFKSANGEAMKRDMEKKIERLGRDVERLKGQQRELQKELK